MVTEDGEHSIVDAVSTKVTARWRDRGKFWIQKSFLTSKQQYWKTGGIQDSERKLFPAQNSVFIRMCPLKEEEDLGHKKQECHIGQRPRNSRAVVTDDIGVTTA